MVQFFILEYSLMIILLLRKNLRMWFCYRQLFFPSGRAISFLSNMNFSNKSHHSNQLAFFLFQPQREANHPEGRKHWAIRAPAAFIDRF